MKSENIRYSQKVEITNGYILSLIGLLVIIPLLMHGLMVQLFQSLELEWCFKVLALFAFGLGSGGLCMTLSKIRMGISYGAVLISGSAFLSILFENITNVSSQTPKLTMIIISAIIAAAFGILNYAAIYYKTQDK